MSIYVTLNEVPLNSVAKIISIKYDFKNKNRLIELGFTEGCKITPIHKSPLGEPIAYLIRGTVIALRSDDAKNILVLKEEV